MSSSGQKQGENKKIGKFSSKPGRLGRYETWNSIFVTGITGYNGQRWTGIEPALLSAVQ